MNPIANNWSLKVHRKRKKADTKKLKNIFITRNKISRTFAKWGARGGKLNSENIKKYFYLYLLNK